RLRPGRAHHFQQETKSMSREIPKPFLIAKQDDGAFRLTLRNTRFNSWGYPLTDSTPVDESFKSAAAARAHAKEHYGAEPGQFASK
ncbi:MAG TPA: hypothetical protein VEZ41_03530, partial [Allosphingosinicella sp.]|nr:hypothetical protein [Allosphingosinicella sp.]